MYSLLFLSRDLIYILCASASLLLKCIWHISSCIASLLGKYFWFPGTSYESAAVPNICYIYIIYLRVYLNGPLGWEHFRNSSWRRMSCLSGSFSDVLWFPIHYILSKCTTRRLSLITDINICIYSIYLMYLWLIMTAQSWHFLLTE